MTQTTLNLRDIRAVLFDLDGVVWRSTEILPGVPDFFLFLRQRGIPYVVVTNNSTRTVDEYTAKVRGLGIPIDGDHIVTSAVVTLRELEKKYPPGTPIYVIGSESLIGLLTGHGYVLDPEAARVVVVGLDVNLTYEKLTIAGRRVLAGAEFIGTNGDLTFPIPDGIIPGSGTLIAAVQAMTGVTPRVMGKPEPAMFLEALERLGTPPAQAMMIGDRLETDIAGAQRVGIVTALVLCGVSTLDDIGPIRPDGVYESLADLHAAWQRV